MAPDLPLTWAWFDDALAGTGRFADARDPVSGAVDQLVDVDGSLAVADDLSDRGELDVDIEAAEEGPAALADDDPFGWSDLPQATHGGITLVAAIEHTAGALGFAPTEHLDHPFDEHLDHQLGDHSAAHGSDGLHVDPHGVADDLLHPDLLRPGPTGDLAGHLGHHPDLHDLHDPHDLHDGDHHLGHEHRIGHHLDDHQFDPDQLDHHDVDHDLF